MPVEIVLASRHEGGRVLIIAHSANRYAFEYLLNEVPLEAAVSAPSEWQPAWLYTLPSGWDS